MIPKRVEERLVRSIGKFQQVLKVAKDRDVNETDTVSIVKDMLSEIFGYDKYLEVTSEFAVRGTFCDLAVKIDHKVEFLIETKAIGLELKEGHLRQALDYCANSGVQWALLTNGINWVVYKVKFEQPIQAELICSFDLMTIDPRDVEHQAKLFVICREGLARDAREEYHEKIQTVNRFLLSALILSDEIVGEMKRELRKISSGVYVSAEEIQKVLMNEVLKRDTIEGDDAARAQTRIRKYYSKLARRTKEPTGPADESAMAKPDEPTTEQ